MVNIIDRVLNSEELLIKKIAAQTASLIRDGKKIINMSQGVPCLPIFQEAKNQMIDFINSNKLPYTDVAGILTVRDKAAEFVNQIYFNKNHNNHNNIKLNNSNIIITSGAIQAINNILTMCVDQNDVILTTSPAYGLYKHQSTILGAIFDTIPTDSSTNFFPTTESIIKKFEAHAIAGRHVRALILCFPNNPTSAMFTSEVAQSLANCLSNLLERFDFALILDEVYVGITYSPVYSILNYASPKLLSSSFLILSASKGLGAMPGARAAWCTFFDPQLLPSLVKVQSAASANASSIAQIGLQGSLNYLLTNPEMMGKISDFYKRRVDYVVSRIRKLQDVCKVEVNDCSATFYVWASFGGVNIDTDLALVSYLRDQSDTPLDVSENKDSSLIIDSNESFEEAIERDHARSKILLLNDHDWNNIRPQVISTLSGTSCGVGIATVPGSAFLMNPNDKFLRFSCARSSLAELRVAMDILENAVIVLNK